MRHSIEVGVSFGLTSGVITTLGLMVGLNSGTSSQIAVIGGILTIAIADSFSDGLGIHISEESENVHTKKEIWESTISTVVVKFIIASSFLIPVLLLTLNLAIIVSVFWGCFLLCIISYRIALKQKINPLSVIAEHLLIAIIVILLAQTVGALISNLF